MSQLLLDGTKDVALVLDSIWITIAVGIVGNAILIVLFHENDENDD